MRYCPSQSPGCPLSCPQASNKALASILGKSNLCFAGMSIAVSISIDGLNLSVPATRQVSAATPGLSPWPPCRTGSMDSLGMPGGEVGAGLCHVGIGVNVPAWRTC